MSPYSIRNILSVVNSLQAQMSLPAIQQASTSPAAFQSLQEDLDDQIRASLNKVRKRLEKRGLTTADLAIRSRRAYQWLSFLSNPSSLSAHLDALQRINLHLHELKSRFGKKGSECQFSFFHQGALYQIRQSSGKVEITVQEGFITAPDAVLTALLEIALFPPTRTARRAVKEFTFSEPYQKTSQSLEYLGVAQDSYAAGEVHHLAESFQRVNQTYFNSELLKPNLVWNNRLTRRKFGHYQWDTDTVMVSKSLDRPGVPEQVVDYVMYHELLHKKLGAKRTKHKRIAHTGEFRQAEVEFSGYEEARRLLNRIARKQARSR